MEARFCCAKWTLGLSVALIQLFFILTALAACTSNLTDADDHKRCEFALQTWSDQALEELVGVDEETTYKLKELLFFLHVPRTGGRTYHHCMLRFLYSSEQQCGRSYDMLRFNASQHCRLLVSHDDYSILTMLPRQMTSMVTNLRHPIDRVFSAYEFSLEVAARSLLLKNSRRRSMPQKVSPSSQASSTLNIWPWKFLVPWMQTDLFVRRDERAKGRTTAPSVTENPYDVSSMAMPLHEFIHQPIVLDIVHNGATFQVAGLTNNSHFEGAGDLRKCVIKYPNLGHYVLDVAKERLNVMLYVGISERHKDTSTLFARVVGRQAILQSQLKDASFIGSDTISTTLGSVQQKKDLDTPISVNEASIQHITAVSSPGNQTQAELKQRSDKLKIDTVEKLIEAYNTCSTKMHGTQLSRRRVSLKSISPVNFTKEARKQVSDRILAEILQLNSLDLELYRHAESLFSEQQVIAYNSSISLGWTERSNVQLILNERTKSKTYAHLIVSKRTYWIYSNWFGSGRLALISGVATIGLGWFVFVSGHRGLKIRDGLHEKI